MTEAQAGQWGRCLTARYGAVWLVSGDSDFNDRSLPVYLAVGEAIHEHVTHPL